MSLAEFEEKEFEGPLNNQLSLGGPMWPPGQVLEHIVGFDAALMVQASAFWALQGFAAPPDGAVILPRWWPWGLARLAVRIRRPPPFRLNLFLQYKRPEYLGTGRAREWSVWGRPYFRFEITGHQQRALDACAGALGSHGLVAYASPAFHARADLFLHVEQGTLAVNTHFAPSNRLSGHDWYTYVDATTAGRAHSRPVRVKPLRLLNGGRGDAPPPASASGGNGRRPADLLADAHRAAAAAIESSPKLVGDWAVFRSTVDRATEVLRVLREGLPALADGSEQPVQDFIFTATFSSMARIGWGVM